MQNFDPVEIHFLDLLLKPLLRIILAFRGI